MRIEHEGITFHCNAEIDCSDPESVPSLLDLSLRFAVWSDEVPEGGWLNEFYGPEELHLAAAQAWPQSRPVRGARLEDRTARFLFERWKAELMDRAEEGDQLLREAHEYWEPFHPTAAAKRALERRKTRG